MTRKASIKESGEEISQAEWERFDAAVAEIQAERPGADLPKGVRPEALGARREPDPRAAQPAK